MKKEITVLAALGLLFIAVSYFAHHYQSELAVIVRSGSVVSPVTFILLTALFVVFVIPLDIAFLIPIGAAVWGPIPTALMSITGWTLGAAVAFGIARKFGVGLVERMIGLERVRAIERRIPKRNVFWSVVLLRMLLSVDILSYVLGLFSSMRWTQYVVATAIGVTPFGFYFAYTGALPFWYQIVAIVAALVVVVAILARWGISREP